jgi:hypothetical protein
MIQKIPQRYSQSMFEFSWFDAFRVDWVKPFELLSTANVIIISLPSSHNKSKLDIRLNAASYPSFSFSSLPFTKKKIGEGM